MPQIVRRGRFRALCLSSVLLLMSCPCFAGGGTGLYLGAGVGQIEGDRDFDDDAGTAKLFAGYNFGWLPFLDLGAELSYMDGGKLHGRVDGHGASLEVDSWQAMGIAGLSLGPFGVYGKAGMAGWDAERRGNGNIDHNYDGHDPVYGIGVRLKLFDVTGRLEFERIDTDDIGNIDSLVGSVIYTF